LLEDDKFQTMDKVGAAATYLTGQIGSIGNTPVLVSPSFPTSSSQRCSSSSNSQPT